MKTLLLAALLFTSPAVANEEKEKSYCDLISEFSENAYEMRQMNVSLSYQLELVADAKELRQIVIDVYKQPRFTTAEIVEREKRSFADKWMLVCIESVE